MQVDRDDWFEEVVSHLAATRLTRHTPDAVALAILGAGSWLGQEVDRTAPNLRRFEVDMRLLVSERPSLVTFRKAAIVDLGPLRWLHNGWEVEVGWRASTLAPLFPVFSGRIMARYGELALSGWYAPPLGVVGQIADRVLLHIAATGTGNWLLARLEAAAEEIASDGRADAITLQRNSPRKA
jgi:hypothetical protein